MARAEFSGSSFAIADSQSARGMRPCCPILRGAKYVLRERPFRTNSKARDMVVVRWTPEAASCMYFVLSWSKNVERKWLNHVRSTFGMMALRRWRSSCEAAWLRGSRAVPVYLLMGSMVKRTSGSLVGVFHFQEYSIGVPSTVRRDLHFAIPSDGGAGPR